MYRLLGEFFDYFTQLVLVVRIQPNRLFSRTVIEINVADLLYTKSVNHPDLISPILKPKPGM